MVQNWKAEKPLLTQPDYWVIKRIDQIGTVITGKTPPTKQPEFWGGTIPFITPPDLHGTIIRNCSRWITEEGLNVVKSLPKGAVLVSCIGYIGKVGLVADEVAVTNQQINAVVADETVDNWFLLFLFHHMRQVLRNAASMTTVPILNKSNFEGIQIPVPPLGEQRTIANFLRTVQQAKEATEKVIAAAQQLRQSLMRHLFTYGPVPFEQADRVELKETEVGAIPMTWEVVQLQDLLSAKIINGAFIRRERFGQGIQFLNVADTYKRLSVQMQGLDRVEASSEDIARYSLSRGDLIFVRSSLKREGVGQCCIIEALPEQAIYDCHLMRVRVNTRLAVPKFVAYFAASSTGKKGLIARSKTTTMTTINQEGLSKTLIPIPPLTTQQRIVAALEALDGKIEAEQRTYNSLQSVFDVLLHQLMTGKTHVSCNIHTVD